MECKHELKHQWQEKAKWLAGLTVASALLGYWIIRGASVFGIFLFLISTSLFAWGALQTFTKPEVQIVGGRMYLFRRLSPKPVILTLNEIQSVERPSETPIWRVPPLAFYLKNGSKITFSTGANEGEMKRIIKFIENKTTLKVKNL